MGKPPCSVSSVNKSDFIEQEMDVYKEDVRTERNIQPLSDDHIKFIRFAHWKINNDGKGIIGLTTNNSYLSGLKHRGMRKKLLDSFDDIYILNLHGNRRIGEKRPDGSKNENVFDIQQIVSIALFVKTGTPSPSSPPIKGWEIKKFPLPLRERARVRGLFTSTKPSTLKAYHKMYGAIRLSVIKSAIGG